MKTFKDIRDTNIFANPILSDGDYKLRPTVKAIIKDKDGNIAILKARGHYLLPGGGVEEGEDKIKAIKREIKEEIGCNIADIEELGTSDQFRNKEMKHYQISFFVASIDGEKGLPTTTQEDELQDVEVVWENKENVFNLLKNQISITDENEYNFCFNARSHFEAFQEFYNKE